MKKSILILFLILILTLLFINILPSEGYKVFKIENPKTIYIDTNNNSIFDENEPVIIENLYYIDENTDTANFPILDNLTEEQKVFLSYKVKDLSEQLLKNKHVKIENNDIYINGKSYSEQMLKSKTVFNNSEETQKALYNYINSINLDDYVLLNTRSKKYHKLSCTEGRKSTNLRLTNKNKLGNDASPCKYCHLNKTFNNNKYNCKNTDDKSKQETSTTFKQIKKPANKFKEDNIEIFFIDLNEIELPSNKCASTACQTLLNEINNAQSSIDFAIYGINNQPLLVNALLKAKERGVNIRWVFDINKSSGNYYEDNEELAKLITSYKTDEVYESKNQTAIMHNKFFIFDKKHVWTGSANISTTDLTGFNANYAALIKSDEIAKIYTNEFEQMYSGLFHNYKKKQQTNFIQINSETYVKPLFSPQDNIINNEIIPLINNAKKYIYIPMFFITHKGISKALINAHNKGIDIKIIQDATNAHSTATIHKELRDANIPVKTENFAGKMHAKSMIIDDNISLIGSMNYTNSGNNKNDENVLIIKSPQIAEYMKYTFIYLWNKIPDKYLKYDPRAESFESTGSCNDGIDNNFDNKIDGQDDGCKTK